MTRLSKRRPLKLQRLLRRDPHDRWLMSVLIEYDNDLWVRRRVPGFPPGSPILRVLEQRATVDRRLH